MTDAASESPDFSNQALFTPAMRQFIEVKNRYPNTLVLFRMGDFYETFFKDAVIANRLIGITLTKRGKLTDGTPIPMAGIPAVSLDTYIARLVRQGESVVIVEQKGNTPGAKGMIEREVSRIVTPGTLTDTSLLPEKSDSILLAASFPKKKTAPIGLVWLTLSNGDFRAEEVTPDSFEAALARIRPSELLVDEDMKREMRTAHPEIAVSTLPDWHFDAKRGASNLCATFGMTALDAWDVTNRTTVLAAANALLDYIRETQVDLVPFIEPLKLVEESQFIVLDPSTRRNLEVDESLSANGEGPTLFPSWITAPPLWEAAKCAAGCANRFVRWKILRPATMPSKRSWATNPRANTSLPYWMRSRMSNALPPASVWVPSVRESSPRFATRSPRFQRLALRSLTRRLTLLPASAGA